jgi:hypothetical protein
MALPPRAWNTLQQSRRRRGRRTARLGNAARRQAMAAVASLPPGPAMSARPGECA